MGTFTVTYFPDVSIAGGLANGGVITPPTTPGWAGTTSATKAEIRGGTAQYFDAGLATISNVGLTFFIDENHLGITLDFVQLINWNSLPAGFQLLTLLLNIPNWTVVGRQVDPSNFVRAVSDPYDSGQVLTLNLIGEDISPVLPQSALGLLGRKIQLTTEGLCAVGGVAHRADLSGVSFEGTYQIINFSWTIEDPGLVDVGTQVTITSPVIGGLNLNDVTLSVNYTDINGDVQTIPISGGDIIFQDEFTFIFLVPNFPVGTTILYVEATSTGTQFSGSVALGPLLTIYFTDGSGIYRLVAGKTNDTLYVNDTGNTIDVKIPDPFAKIAFIP